MAGTVISPSLTARLVDQKQGVGSSNKIAAYESLLRRCAREGRISDARLVHQHLEAHGYGGNAFLANLVVQMYGKCGDFEQAYRVFESISSKDLFSWNLMIVAFAENGQLGRARETFDGMPRRDVVSWNAMLAAYVNAGLFNKAFEMFDRVPDKDAVSWNSLLAAYARSEKSSLAVNLLWKMCLEGTRPTEVSFVTVLDVCGLAEGRLVHDVVASAGLDRGVPKVGNALITMYGECSSLDDAVQVFEKMVQRNVVSWTAMLWAYAENGEIQKARETFDGMTTQKNLVSWNAMIQAYAQAGNSNQAMEVLEMMNVKSVMPNQGSFMSVLSAGLDVEQGKLVHVKVIEAGLESDVLVATALCTMYGLCGEIELAKDVFDGLTTRDLVSWNAMLSAYVQNNQAREGLEFFYGMELEGVRSNEVTMVVVLDAVASLSLRSTGARLHARADGSGLSKDVNVLNAIVNMYGKCGEVEKAGELFDSMSVRDIVSWNVSIAAYAHNGFGELALQQFKLMCLEGFGPDEVTFLVILSACSHAGLFEEGVGSFLAISADWCLRPTASHFQCMVDILGRAGQLSLTEELIESMPFIPQEIAWRALLGGCRINSDVQRAVRAAENLIVLDEQDSSSYVLMSNLYASVGNWKNAEKMREAMRSRRVRKVPGLSWIEVNGKVHTFAANDKVHPRISKIRQALHTLDKAIRAEGYLPDMKAALHDVNDEEKAAMLLHHSEKLAIAFGIMNTPEKTPLFVTKNIRVCSDCHSAIKYITKVTSRRIVMRDTNRFHHVESGSCSCGDYW